MNKVALFDFCETIANFQTADNFVKYVREQSNNSKMIRKEAVRQFLLRIKLIYVLSVLLDRSSINKRFVLWQLKGFNRAELEQYAKSYYRDAIKPNLINNILEELLRLQQNNWRIVIVSAGYEIYLKYFCQEYAIPMEDLISVKIKFKKGKCLGVFDGGDRLWDKTKKLEELFDRRKIYSVAYSDSMSDLPLLKWANEGIVVQRKDKPKWASKYNLKEILW